VAVAAEEAAAAAAVAVAAEEAAAAAAAAATAAAAAAAAAATQHQVADTCVAASALPFLAWALALARSLFLVLSAGFLSLCRFGAGPPALSMADHLRGFGMEECHVVSVAAHLHGEYGANTPFVAGLLDETDILETASACCLKKAATRALLVAWRTARISTVSPAAAPAPTTPRAVAAAGLPPAPEDASPTSVALFPGSPGGESADAEGNPPASTTDDLSKGHLDFGNEAQDIKDCCRDDGASSMDACGGEPTTTSIGGCGANFTGPNFISTLLSPASSSPLSPLGSALITSAPIYPPPPLPGVPSPAETFPV
jgi:hypothetical protein